MIANNLLERITSLEKIINRQFKDTDKDTDKNTDKDTDKNTSTNKNCNLIEDVIAMNKCDIYIKSNTEKQKQSFDKCIFNTKDINDVINCVKNKGEQINDLVNADSCNLDTNCKYKLLPDDNWKAQCLVEANNMKSLMNCINEFKILEGDTTDEKIQPKFKKGKGKGKGKVNGKSKGQDKKDKTISDYQKINKLKEKAIKKLQAKIKKLKKRKDGDTIIIPTSTGAESFNTSKFQGTTGFHNLTKPVV